MSYVPSPPPVDEKDLLRWTLEELRQVGRALENVDGVIFQKRYREPEKRIDGMTVLADGTSWNPGSGAGLYRWDAKEGELLNTVIWEATPTAADVGGSWTPFMEGIFESVDTIEPGTIENAPDGTPSLRAHWDVGDQYGFSEICETVLDLPQNLRENVTLRYMMYFDPSVDYTKVADAGGSLSLAILTFPGLVGGQVWPGPNGLAYPVGGEAQEGDNWSARIRMSGNGRIAPYLYVQNRPGAFGWFRINNHPLRINDLRGVWSLWEETCIMNEPGIPDGRCILRVNGETIVDVGDVMYRSAGFNSVVCNGIRLIATVQGVSVNEAAIAFDYWTRNFSMMGSRPLSTSLGQWKFLG